MNDEEQRHYQRGWNDPPYTFNQTNKQAASAVPLNKRYKYPVADQQMLNNQMYQQPGNYMQNAYGQAAGYGAAPNQLPPNQYSQQSAYTQNPTMAAAYNQQISNAYAGAQTLTGQQQQAYAYAAAQQQQQQPSYAQQQQLPQYSPYGQQAGHQLTNQSIVSQQPLAATNQSAYQTTQTSAYLPNTINPAVTTAVNQQAMNQKNPALAQTAANQQIPVSNSMMQSVYGNPTNAQQQYNQQYAQQQQQLYNQAATNPQYQIHNQYQY